MRRLLVVLAIVIGLLAIGVAATVLGAGPFALRGAPSSVVFVAVSRSSDETDANEIEAIDLASGTRDLFDAGGRITAMALSPDRRSLYVGLDGGKILFLDATTGIEFGHADLGGPTVVSLVPTGDGRTLFAITVTNVESAVVPIDLSTRKLADRITFAQPAGSAVLRGDALIVPFGDARGTQVAFIDVHTFAVTAKTMLSRTSLATPAAFSIGGARTGIVAFDSGAGPGGASLRVYVLTDPLHWSDVPLEAPFLQGSGRTLGFRLQAAAIADGPIHVCVASGTAGRRSVIGTDLKVRTVGADCGPLAGGDVILMASRAPAQLLVIDGTSGAMMRTLPLTGVPARLVH